ncbi:MAG TPA: hypothetical protein VHV51_04175 [Polyangiaceae bacterium]|jgi:hypothetical protein|nr:hypothetical protein [Polyangiaceae bacterium]
MSISATTGYMSNEDIMTWMQEHTDQLYTNMRDDMSGANHRADAESALDAIKAELQNSSGKDASKVTGLINDALKKYGDIPDVLSVLQPMADKFNGEYTTAQTQATNAQTTIDQINQSGNTSWIKQLVVQSMQSKTVVAVNIDSTDATNWATQIDNKVDALGKQDQLDMINIQELNSEVNQAKQTASALMDAADKSAEDTISHIS